MTSSAMRDLVIVTCAVSAGVHGALTPEHVREGVGAGNGFLISSVLLAAVVVWLTVRPRSELAPVAATLVLGGLLLTYVLVVTTGVPYLHPNVEPVDGLAVWTKLVELAGLLVATRLTRLFDGVRPFHTKHLKGAVR
jgi:hypothetical protein